MKTLTQLFIFLACTQLYAQNVGYNWTKQFTGNTNSPGSMTLDAGGNIVTTGYFQNLNNFDPGPGTATLSNGANSIYDVFVSKLDPSGNFLWVRQIGGSGWDQGTSITTDPAGNIYATGLFEGTVDFDPGAATFTLSSPGNRSMFICKLDPAGNFMWAKVFGTTANSYYERTNSISIDVAGNILLAGNFGYSTDFDPGPGTYTMNCFGATDAFISKFDATGNFIWAKQFGGQGLDDIWGLTSDTGGNIYASGSFEQITDLDPGVAVTSFTSVAGLDMYLCKLDASGAFIYARQIGGIGNEEPRSMKLDNAGNLLIAGRFSGLNSDFDPGAGTYTLSSGTSNISIFVCKLTNSGNFVWAKQMGGSAYIDEAFAIATDAAGNVYSTGDFSSLNSDFDPGPGVYQFNSSQFSAFISKLDALGNFVWAKDLGGTGTAGGHAMVVNSTGDIYSCGDFLGAIDFDPGFPINTFTTGAYRNTYIHKLSACTTTQNLSLSGQSSLNGCDKKVTTFTVNGAPGINWVNGIDVSIIIGNGNSYSTPTLSPGVYFYYAESTQTCGALPLAITLTVHALPVLTISGTSVCIGSTIALTASGASTYTWNTGTVASSISISPALATTYSITGKDLYGCIDTLSKKITVNPTPTLTTASSNSLICSGETVTIQTTGALTYSWNTGSQTGKITVAPLTTTEYTITGLDTNGCSSIAVFTQSVDACLAIEHVENDQPILLISPNPNKGVFTARVNRVQEDAELKIYNNLGVLIHSEKITQNVTEVNTENWNGGIYFVRIIENKQVKGTQKIIRQ